MNALFFTLFGIFIVSTAVMVTLILTKTKVKPNDGEKKVTEEKPFEITPETLETIEEHYLNKNVKIVNNKNANKTNKKDNELER